MLPASEQAALTRAVRGTPVGEAFRRHWLPLLPADKAPAAGGTPVRLRALGETLALFRDLDGRLGLVDGYCPHEGGSLASGHVVGGGVQCLLHGWTFGVDGRRVDAGARFSPPVRVSAYRAVVAGGRVWGYLGAPEACPPLPG